MHNVSNSSLILMASRNYHFSALLIAILFLSLSLLPLPSGGVKTSMMEEEVGKKILGSRPPGCVNKCMSCRPCEATLVIPPHKTTKANFVNSAHGEDDTYYLLTWKCRCGNKIYQP